MRRRKKITLRNTNEKDRYIELAMNKQKQCVANLNKLHFNSNAIRSKIHEIQATPN